VVPSGTGLVPAARRAGGGAGSASWFARRGSMRHGGLHGGGPLGAIMAEVTDWRHAGQVTLSADDDLVFPDVDSERGLYRFTITGGPGVTVYVGQAGGRNGLRGRFRAYRYSARRSAIGLDRLTTRRNAHLIHDALEKGHTVCVDVITMDDKASRDRTERYKIAELASIPGIRVLNRAHYR
jgi:hypothetical protein